MDTVEHFRFRVCFEDSDGVTHFNHIRADKGFFQHIQKPEWQQSIREHYQKQGFTLVGIQYYEAVELELAVEPEREGETSRFTKAKFD